MRIDSPKVIILISALIVLFGLACDVVSCHAGTVALICSQFGGSAQYASDTREAYDAPGFNAGGPVANTFEWCRRQGQLSRFLLALPV